MELAVGVLMATSLTLALFVFQQQRKLKLLRCQHAQMSLALDHVNACIYIKDQDSRYLYANRPCLELFNVTAEQLPGSQDHQFFPADTVERLRKIDLGVIQDQQASLEEVEVREADGKTTLYLESKFPIPEEPGEPRTLVGISTDVTELWTLRARLEKQAWHDSLTGLYNRRKLDQMFSQIIRQQRHNSQQLSLILMDLDHFKTINDKYGHDQGDMVLRQVANILQAQCDEHCVYGRWGGEEFLVIYPGTETEATVFAQQLRSAISNHRYGFDQVVTASFGISSSDEMDTEHSLLVQADKALYKAKQQGRDCITCSSSSRIEA